MTMTMPRFVAEASLHARAAGYRKGPEASPNEGLAPAQSIFERRPDLIDEAIIATEPVFGRRLCWIPYYTFCLGENGRPYRCVALRYIC